jgi:hypothetical protein
MTTTSRNGSLAFPERLRRNSGREQDRRRYPAHRAWVRGHACSVPECSNRNIECAHVRIGTDGSTGLKPSDYWTISLCRDHHAEQHRLGELSFARRYGLDLFALATAFARRSPHRAKWEGG